MYMNTGPPNFIGSSFDLSPQPVRVFWNNFPSQMTLPVRGSPGFFLGLPSGPSPNYVGIPHRSEEHIIVVGGSGSGKSSGVAMPTLSTWGEAICATDVKGELSEFYEKLYQKGLVDRPYIVFDPIDVEGPSYDPFWWLLQDDNNNLVNNIWDIVRAIHPAVKNDIQPFWAESERGIFAAALLYYFKCGLSFSEAIIAILARPVSALCEDLLKSPDVRIQFSLGETASMKPEILANIDRGLRNKLMLFATDPYISHAFRGKRENAVCFTWEDLDTHNIFLRIPANKIEQWSGAVNLMYSQLIRHLERRPEMHSKEGANNVQTLLLMDEFARFGRLEMITAALATLRSKNVNICLMIQSATQLDRIYDENERRIIFDNCGYLAILRANDADTQKYLCNLIGTRKNVKCSMGENFDKEWATTGYSKQISEDRDLLVQPHELSTLNDVLLLTPYGFCRAEKFQMDNKEMWYKLFSSQIYVAKPRLQFGDTSFFDAITKESAPLCRKIRLAYNMESCPASNVVTCPATIAMNRSKKNEGATIMSIRERNENANKRIEAATQQQQEDGIDRETQEEAQVGEIHEGEVQEDESSRHHCIIGDLVAGYFPTVRGYKLGTDDEERIRLEAFLFVLSVDPDLVDKLKGQADQLVSEDPDGEWRVPV